MSEVTGDDRALIERLLTPLLEPAYRFSFHLTRNEADAEDLLQDACQLAFQKFFLGYYNDKIMRILS